MKTRFLTFCVASVFLTAGVFAGDDNYSEPEYSAVKYYDFDLEIENEGGNVYFEWNEFKKDEKIKWWKLAFSQKTSDISYPENDARFLWDTQDLDEAKQWFNAGSYYFRLCAVTHENNRYCGEVKKYSFEEKKYEKEEMTICTMEYAPVCGKKDWEYTTYSNNCMREAAGAYKIDMKYCEDDYNKPKACTREYMPVCGMKNGKYYTFSNKCMMESENATYKYSGKCSTETNDGISEASKVKIKERLDDFMQELEKKWYSDEKIVDTIDILIEKLEEIGKQPKYTLLVDFIIEILEWYRSEYENDLDILDDLLNDF